MSTNREKETCDTCHFFEPEGSGIAGKCHRYPPVVSFTQDGDVQKPEFTSAITIFDNWCGEHLAKDAPT
ncbi:MAG: hypothetical protein OXH79_03130 [Boseongicola sp.]|nr:hypothetical protein [Boseongicola sp.]